MSGIPLSRRESKKVAESLREVICCAEREVKVAKKVTKLALSAKTSIKGVIGNKNDSMRSEKVKKAALIFLTFPGDPTGVTYAVGGALYGISRATKVVERKEMGIRDLIRYYRRLGIELEELLRL